MTNPHDQIRDDIVAEDYSLASVASVAIVMIISTLLAMSILL